MLDQTLISQLQTAFAPLQGSYTLALAPSASEHQAAMRDLADGLAAASPRITVAESGAAAPVPRLALIREGVPTGIAFRGVPGGHEFTSLVLSVLNADGRGRMPDEGVRARIRALRGPVRLRTFVSLECTNCPDVVQALNQCALVHPDFQHEMVDGSLAQEEAARLGVQGVPAVFAGDELVHVGKADLATMIDTLESKLGREAVEAPAVAHHADLVVVGGGPAGVAAAVYAARKGQQVTLVAGKLGGQVRDTLGIENLISVPYTEGPKLAQALRDHLTATGVTVLDNRQVEGVDDGDEKTVRCKGGETVSAPQVIIATGAAWRRLGVPGETEHLGRGVAFCPHCDGPFYKGKRVAVVGGGNSGVEAAIDLAGICSEVTLLEYGPALKADAVLQRRLASLPNARVITRARTTAVVGDGARVSAVRYQDQAGGEERTLELDGIFVQIGLSPNSAAVRDLVEVNKAGEIVVDARGRTSRPGIYAAGDVATTPFKQIVIAMGDGAKTVLAAFEDRMRAA